MKYSACRKCVYEWYHCVYDFEQLSLFFQTCALPTSISGIPKPHQRNDCNISSDSYAVNQCGVGESSCLSGDGVLNTPETIEISGDTHEAEVQHDYAYRSSDSPRYVPGLDGRLLKCKVCGKEFLHLSSFKNHVRIHTGSRPYACTFCDKKFSLSYNCRVHERIHTGYRPFVCKVCNKGFNRSTHLRRHEQCHLRKSTPLS